jgi:hypothetical protein
MGFNMKSPTLGISSAISVSTIMLISGNILGIKKTIAICISLLFILLLALQLNSVGFTPASAQLGGPDGNNNLNLNGIWERIDDDQFEDIVYITQEGSNITATFDPIGVCYEDPNIRTEDTSFASSKLEFRGNLFANTIQGQFNACNLEKRTSELLGLQLRVSIDGKTLDGYFTDPVGQQHILKYVFLSSIPDVSLEIHANKPVYDSEEHIEISGQITNIRSEGSDVFIEVYGPDNEQAFSQSVFVNPNGSFFTSFDLHDEEINNGTYRAVASYAETSDEITFGVQQHDPPIALPTQDSEAEIPAAPTGSTESKPTLQVQCIQTPVFPQANQSITVTARVVDEWTAPKVADSIEIEIRVMNSNRTEPVITSGNVNSSSRFNYTIGPFANLTTISYGCRGIDNSTSASVFSGWKTIVIGDFNEVIGSFNESRAVPVPSTGDSNSNLDILFIADNKAFSSPTDPDFLIDVETAIWAYYNQSILLKHQNKTNFWIAQDMAQAKGCDSIPPINWDSEYFSFEYAVILHRDDSLRDCTEPGTELSTANMATVAQEGYIVLHELGHRPFGLADEYDNGNPSAYINSYPYQNVFSTEQECDNVRINLPAEERICRKIPYGTVTQNVTSNATSTNEYFTTDTKPNDLMVDYKQFQELDVRRVEKWFEGCLTPHDNEPPPEVRCKSGAE